MQQACHSNPLHGCRPCRELSNYRTENFFDRLSFPSAAPLHRRVGPTCNCGISCTMSERCAAASAGMTDVYDVIPLLVMRRISSAETIWEFFRLPLSPLPPLRTSPNHHLLISVLGSASLSAGRLPPVATDGSHQSPASRQPHELLGRRSVPAHPRTTQGRKQMEGGYGASIKTRKKMCDVLRRGEEVKTPWAAFVRRICIYFFLFSIIITFVLKFCHVQWEKVSIFFCRCFEASIVLFYFI